MKDIKNIDIHRIEDFIKQLNEDELIYLNRLLVERIKLFRKQKNQK